MSDAWTDLGYEEKSKRKELNEKPSIYHSWKPVPKYSHESEKETRERKEKRLEAILKLCPKCEIGENGVVSVVIQSRRFDFWPASDCWYSHTKQTYGHGIEKLLKLIEEKLGV